MAYIYHLFKYNVLYVLCWHENNFGLDHFESSWSGLRSTEFKWYRAFARFAHRTNTSYTSTLINSYFLLDIKYWCNLFKI